VQRLQSVPKAQVTRPGPLETRPSRRRRRMHVHRKVQKLTLGRLPERAWNPGIQEADDGLEHLVGGIGVPPVNAENPPAQTQHHRLVGMSQDLLDVAESERLKSFRKTILEEEALPRGSSTPLPRCHSP
jgi:hypothetical protein